MNPNTTLTSQQITTIFRHHQLAQNPEISRINIGFTNEVHRVDNYILKVYLRKDGEQNYVREAKLYQQLETKALTPKLVLSDGSKKLIDKPYIIYEIIEGEALGYRWHELSDQQRREIIRTLCQQIRIIADLEPNAKLGHSWQSHVKMHLDKDLAEVERQRLLPLSQIAKIKNFVKSTLPSVIPEVIGYIYWDVHLDNMIVKNDKMVGMIDFEHVDPVSIDYLLNNVQHMVNYPQLNLSQETEKYADKKDYMQVMTWFKEFYPEVFDFPHLEDRLKLYDLEAALRLLPRFPKAKQLHERLKVILSMP